MGVVARAPRSKRGFRPPWPAVLCALILSSMPAPDALGDSVAVPIAIQIALLVKIAAYDRNLASRGTGSVMRVLILQHEADRDSARATEQVKHALMTQPTIAGLAHEELVTTFTGTDELAATCRDAHVGIVFLTQGFSDDNVSAIVRGLDGVDVLTAGADPRFVPRGVVLGFDLVSGKPKMLVNLGQAMRQHVSLSPRVLALMTVYR